MIETIYRKILECLDTRSTWNNIRRFFGEYLRNTLDARRFRHAWENIWGMLGELEILGEICKCLENWKYMRKYLGKYLSVWRTGARFQYDNTCYSLCATPGAKSPQVAFAEQYYAFTTIPYLLLWLFWFVRLLGFIGDWFEAPVRAQ